MRLRPRSPIRARSIASPAARVARLAPLAALGALLAACAMPVHTDASAPAPDPFNPAATQLLDDTQWTLIRWQHADGSSRAVPGGAGDASGGQPLTLDLSSAGGRRHASGFSGCNRFAGSYVLKNGLLSFSMLAGTRMACVGPGGEIEPAFLDALHHIARSGVQWREPRELQLVLDNGDRLTFAQRKP